MKDFFFFLNFSQNPFSLSHILSHFFQDFKRNQVTRTVPTVQIHTQGKNITKITKNTMACNLERTSKTGGEKQISGTAGCKGHQQNTTG